MRFGGAFLKNIKLYRRRYVPDEKILLKDDQILYISDTILITKWNVLHIRNDIDHGISAYFLDQGYKVSKIYDKQHNLVYWYCDIIEVETDMPNSSYTFHDLLVDIVVYPDGHTQIMDLDEIAEMLKSNKLNNDIIAKALYRANDLLHIIYNGDFYKLQEIIERHELSSIAL